MSFSTNINVTNDTPKIAKLFANHLCQCTKRSNVKKEVNIGHFVEGWTLQREVYFLSKLAIYITAGIKLTIKQARRCDNYLQIWNYESLIDPLTHLPTEG